MQNPLLNYDTELPDFKSIKPNHFEPAIDFLINSYNELIKDVVKIENPTWKNSIQVMDEASAKINFAFNIIDHLNNVQNTKEVREAYERTLPKIVNFSTDISQNKDLLIIYEKLSKSSEYQDYSIAQKKIIENAIKGFKLSGVDLPEDKKKIFKEINQKLSDLSNRFEKNTIDSTQSFSYHVEENKSDILKKLPKHTISLAEEKAKSLGKKGWVLTLDFPCYNAVMSYLDNREIREIFYKSNVTKASELSNDGKFDNSKIIDEILELRAKRSEILGFKNYAEYSLARKMANNTEEVVSFLEELALRAKLIADKELSELEAFAKKLDNLDKLEPWDATYYSTLYQKINYDFSEEDIRPYFPEDKVFTGLSKLVENIFGITITEIKDFTKWHDTVKLFEVRDDEGNLRGKFYSDLYARDYKRSGAWMADLRSRMLHANGDLEYPIAFLEGNFTPPSKEKPALLSHSEVNVLFHEVGHTLQHVLTQVNYSGVAGINGIEYDAIELPSQFMENWCWEREVIDDISGHFETGEKLPNAEYDKLIALKNYQSAMQMVRQIEFALFDFRIHMKEGLDANLSVQEILNDVRSKVAVMKPKEYNRFQHAFSHIFAGGYAAGYYSYKWAEVLSSDAFSKFEEVGKFDKATGKLFRETILEQGGSKPAMDIFIEFRGRKPSIDALLRHNGI